MVITIHQPDFLPWLGFFDRWSKSDLYIILDDVQFLRKGWHNRDKIKTAKGAQWLTLPIVKKGRYDQLICDVEINNDENWQRKHLGLIKTSYSKASNFKLVFSIIEKIYSAGYSKMIDLNIALLKEFALILGINVPCRFSSEYKVTSIGTQRLVDLMSIAGGDVYLTGQGSKGYLEEEMFEQKNIKVLWHDYEHPIYSQLYGEFLPMLSTLDYLMNKDEN